jgi:hypothetical protein
MLEEALGLAQSRSLISFNWHDVDYHLLEKLANSSDEVSAIVSRLMLGDLYGCIGIYSTSLIKAYEMIVNRTTRQPLESELGTRIRKLKIGSLKNAVVALHAIKDLNNTQRQIKAVTSKGKRIKVGVPTRRVLVGVFYKNIHLGMTAIKQDSLEKWGVRPIVQKFLQETLKDASIKELIPYGEVNEVKT